MLAKSAAVPFLGILMLASFGAAARAASGDGAGDKPPKPTGKIVNDSPEAIVVTSPGGPTYEIHHQGAGRHGRWSCHYYLVSAPDGGFAPTPLFSPGPIAPKAGNPVDLRCIDENDQVTYDQVFVFDPAEPLPGFELPARAAAEALKLLVIHPPTVRLSPPATVPQLVGVPTWLWIDDPWMPLHASASLGGVTATVTATPTSVQWQLDDATAVTCPGPGTPYDPARPAVDQTSDCTLTFGQPGPHTLRATVTYTTGWTASNGEAEPLDDVTRTSTVPLNVNEAQALIR